MKGFYTDRPIYSRRSEIYGLFLVLYLILEIVSRTLGIEFFHAGIVIYIKSGSLSIYHREHIFFRSGL